MATQKKARSRVKGFLAIVILISTSVTSATEHILVMQGSGGASEFEERFSEASELWIQLAAEVDATVDLVSPATAGSEAKQKIRDWITSPEREKASSIWIVYQGHGTFNAGGAKLNLPGEDLSATELAKWLEGINKEMVFIHGGAASAPFIAQLSGDNRVIITATRSPSEQNYARFGERFAQALADESSDIDRDNSVSLLEAFLSASNAVETFYKEAGRLSSEHALLDDNGDGKGTPATLFSGLRLATETGQTASDGRLAQRLSLSPNDTSNQLSAEQLEQRHELEQELEVLYSQKGDMSEDDYYEKLEIILTKLARFYIIGEES
ncbi:hypothetical protein [Pelagicoccus sp. SDUM812002]|uniref:hypothetical protein n=1 Tax=Pelagicoccus sp. SDUM812002 TaxID=3041266 RepID=UPI00281061CA|nr:hypothetical protein [Pelagicoccus sp. SDUM812002]MDQ8184046.1 hypothetical protein [Pelagicoccus sp. SDUM812002]